MTDDADAAFAPTPDNSVFEWALRFTESLPGRTAEAFQGVRLAFSPILGMTFNLAQRLIDAKKRGGGRNDPDEAGILLCNRLFNEAFAGYLLLSRGLVGPAGHHLRAVVETANLATLLVLQPGLAASWLRGKEYSPGRVRSLIEASDTQREWYAVLSKITHANYIATRSSVHPVPDREVEALAYGGRLVPRAAASNACAFLFAIIPFLSVFYARNAERLQQLDLLWKPGTLAAGDDTVDITWDQVLRAQGALVEAVHVEIEKLPDDALTTDAWVREMLASMVDTDVGS